MGNGKRALLLFLAISLAAVVLPAEDWTQWGGPDRNFKASTRGLASAWPPGGPHSVWSRELGEGYSSILVEGKRLYTMYREKAGPTAIGKQDQEVVVALDAANGKTFWEYRYDAPVLPEMIVDATAGPRGRMRRH